MMPPPAEPGKGFAMVPAWLAWKQPTPAEMLVYVHLALFGTFNPGTATYEQCRPSKSTLADGDPRRGYPGTGLGVQVVARALRGLEAKGAIIGEPAFDPVDGRQLPTVYRVQFGHVIEAPAPHITSDTGGVSDQRNHESAGQDPVSDQNPPGGIADDMGPVSPAIPGPGITSDTQPITPDPEPTPIPPKAPTAGPATLSVVEDGEGEEDPRQELQEPAERALDRVLADLPASRRPRGGARIRLVDAITEHLAAGWTERDLADAISGSFNGVAVVAKVLTYRIGELGDPPPAPAPRVRTIPPPPVDDPVPARLLADGGDPAAAKAYAAEQIAAALAKRKAS